MDSKPNSKPIQLAAENRGYVVSYREVLIGDDSDAEPYITLMEHLPTEPPKDNEESIHLNLEEVDALIPLLQAWAEKTRFKEAVRT